MEDEAAVVLLNPKTPFNVGNALRGCSVFGVPDLRWTGTRVLDPRDSGKIARSAPNLSSKIARLPREERMKDYNTVRWFHQEDALDDFIGQGYVPVCVEVMADAESLPSFTHPARPLYIFGPEDSGIGRATKALCHRFVTIPSSSCLNLAAAVNVVLYDRVAKREYAAAVAALMREEHSAGVRDWDTVSAVKPAWWGTTVTA